MHKGFYSYTERAGKESGGEQGLVGLESTQEGPGNAHIRKDSMKVMKWVIWLEEKAHKLQHIKIMRVNELS